MSKRNFILLIVVLAIAGVVFVGFLYVRPNTNTPLGTDSNTGTNFIAKFNPFGNNPGATPPPTTPAVDNGENNIPAIAEPSKLVEISTVPVAGFTVFTKERLKEIPPVVTGDVNQSATPATTPPPATKTPVKIIPPPTEFAPAVRYVEKALGVIAETFADKIEEVKLSGTTIPKVYDAYFGNNASTVAMRHLKLDDTTIETFVGIIPKEIFGKDIAVIDKMSGYFLPDNVKDISMSRDTLKMFYLFENKNVSGNTMIGTVINLAEKLLPGQAGKKIQIFDSPFTEWLSSWGSDKTITLSTKPSSGIQGYTYTLDSEKKTLSKTLGGINGLTTLPSPDGKMILVGDSSLSLSIYHKDTGTTDNLGLSTLPEKCLWGKASDFIYCAVPKSVNAGQYPDNWYQGEISFNDQLWKIDVKSRATTMLIDPLSAPGGEQVDGTKLQMDEGGNYLFFVNKKDSSLWELNLK